MSRLRVLLSCYVVVAVGAGLRDTAHAANDLSVYGDGLGSAWENWSWASVDFASTAVVHSGTASIAVTAGPWTALWLRHPAFDTTDFGNVSFWINGGPVGGQRLHVAATLADAGQAVGFDIPPLAPGTWQQVTIPLSALGAVAATNFTGFWIQEWTGNAQPVFYVDDVVMTRAVPIIPPPPLDHGMALYDDRFAEGWQNWSWARVDPANARPVSSGTSSIAVRAGPALDDYLGSAARRVEIICTENNSVFSNPGKQTTSLVNGLFMADSLANIMKTEFNGFFWWNLRNGQEAANNNDPTLYGWRPYGDYGIVTAATPAGPADRYPTFYVYKLLQHFARGGERVIAAASDYTGVGIYAVRDRRAHTLNVLLINKHPTATLDVNIAIRGFHAARTAEVFSYGIPQDEAARTGTGSADVARSTAAVHGSTFTWRPAPYSATVLRFARDDRDRDDDDDHDGHGHDDRH